jgi:hypothetical protein
MADELWAGGWSQSAMVAGYCLVVGVEGT